MDQAIAIEQAYSPTDPGAQEPLVGMTDPEVRLRLAMSVARLGDWWTDGGEYIHFSTRAAEIYGLGPRQSVKRSDIDGMIHADDREPVLKRVAEALEAQQDFDVEYRVRRASDGAIVWVLGRGKGVYDDTGRPIGLLGVVADITARKRAQEAERLRVEEVDHRDKNLLMVVQALIQLTPFDTREAYIQALTGRVSALARTHSLLARAQWIGVGLEELVRQELQAFDRAQGHRIVGPLVRISATGAQPLSMVLHELATNAAKHGALRMPGGVLSVEWALNPDGSLTVIWREPGASGSDPETGPGFGTQLLDRLAVQLGGSVRRRIDADGLVATIAIGSEHFTAGSTV